MLDPTLFWYLNNTSQVQGLWVLWEAVSGQGAASFHTGAQENSAPALQYVSKARATPCGPTPGPGSGTGRLFQRWM